MIIFVENVAKALHLWNSLPAEFQQSYDYMVIAKDITGCYADKD